MITLALAQLQYFFAYQLGDWTGGENGVQLSGRGTLFGLPLENDVAFYYAVLAVAALGTFFVVRVVRSPFGAVLGAMRENEQRAIALGYRVDRYKLVAFVLSGTLAGVAGVLFAVGNRLSGLDGVDWHTSGKVVMMSILGGIGTVFGPIAGAGHLRVARLLRLEDRRSATRPTSSWGRSSRCACCCSGAGSSASCWRCARSARSPSAASRAVFVTAFRRKRGAKTDDAFPWTVPALRALDELRFDAPVTFLMGENGCGKSTLLEALAVATEAAAAGAEDVDVDATLAGARRLAAAFEVEERGIPRVRAFFRAEDAFGFTKRIEREMKEIDADADAMLRDEKASDFRRRLGANITRSSRERAREQIR